MGFLRYSFKYLALLSILACAGISSASAGNFEPGSVILLKRDHGPASNDQPQSSGNSRALKNITIVPQNGQPIIVTKGAPSVENQTGRGGQPLAQAGAGSSNADSLGRAYAGHLFTSACSEDYRDSLAPKTEKNINLPKLWSAVQSSCKCLSNTILQAVGPADLTDYVMYNYGWQDPDTEDPEVAAYGDTPISDQIGAIATDDGLRAKCGFLN